MESYLASISIFAGIYAILALGLNLCWGQAGLVNLGLAGFYALGGYGSAIVTTKLGLPIPVGMLISFLVAAAGGALLMSCTLRLRGDYLAIVTLGFAEVVRLIATNETWLTNGTDGISGIPGPYRGMLTPEQYNFLYLALVVVVLLAVFWFSERMRKSPYGRVLRAIREDDQVAAVAGKFVARYRLEAFSIAAGIVGLGGALYAHYTSYIAPEIFSPLITIYIFFALTAGGSGNNYGVVLGAVLLMGAMEATRFLAEFLPGVSGVQSAAFREIVLGVGLLVIMRLRPRGLLIEPKMTVQNSSRKSVADAMDDRNPI